MASFPQASPPTPCAHLYPPPYAPHALPITWPAYRYISKTYFFPWKIAIYEHLFKKKTKSVYFLLYSNFRPYVFTIQKRWDFQSTSTDYYQHPNKLQLHATVKIRYPQGSHKYTVLHSFILQAHHFVLFFFTIYLYDLWSTWHVLLTSLVFFIYSGPHFIYAFPCEVEISTTYY